LGTLIAKLSREHPSLVFALCYLLASSIGVIYSYFFYNEFDLNIVKFVDLSDFLLASIQEPISILLFFGVGIWAAGLWQLDFLLRKKFSGYGRWMVNKAYAKYTDPIGATIVVVFFVGWLVRDFAIGDANDIKAGIVDEYNVKFSDESLETP